MLRQLAQSYLDTHFTRPDQAVADKVRSLIRQCLSTGLAAPAPVAGMLAVTVRTLQRRLLAEGTSFDTLKDEVRRAMFADFMARQPPPPLSQVAAMLDYGYQSALSRSCRRWFGVAPSEYTGQA
ncbi:HTH-type transcriptional regulator VirS [compost metagenome]